MRSFLKPHRRSKSAESPSLDDTLKTNVGSSKGSDFDSTNGKDIMNGSDIYQSPGTGSERSKVVGFTPLPTNNSPHPPVLEVITNLPNSSSSSSLKKLNPMNYIRSRLSSISDDDPPIPSPEDYKEAGIIFGTRIHDWGSPTSSISSPPLHSSLQQAQLNRKSIDSSESSVHKNPLEGLGISSILIKPQKSPRSSFQKDLEQVDEEEELLDQVQGQPQEETHKDHDSQQDSDQRSVFSFEDSGIGRNSSIYYHKPSPAHPSFIEDEYDYDTLIDELNYDGEDGEDFEEDTSRLFSSQLSGIQDHIDDSLDEQFIDDQLRGLSLKNAPARLTSPLRLDKVDRERPLSIMTDLSNMEVGVIDSMDNKGVLQGTNILPTLEPSLLPDSNQPDHSTLHPNSDDLYYDDLLDEVNAVPEDDYDGIIRLAPAPSVKRSRSRQMKLDFGDAPAKTWSRSSSIIRLNEKTTVTLYANSPALSKKPSSSSTLSEQDSGSGSGSSSFSTPEPLYSPAEPSGISYASLLDELPRPSIVRQVSLTPISERSFDSEFSTSPVKA